MILATFTRYSGQMAAPSWQLFPKMPKVEGWERVKRGLNSEKPCRRPREIFLWSEQTSPFMALLIRRKRDRRIADMKMCSPKVRNLVPVVSSHGIFFTCFLFFCIFNAKLINHIILSRNVFFKVFWWNLGIFNFCHGTQKKNQESCSSPHTPHEAVVSSQLSLCRCLMDSVLMELTDLPFHGSAKVVSSLRRCAPLWPIAELNIFFCLILYVLNSKAFRSSRLNCCFALFLKLKKK